MKNEYDGKYIDMLSETDDSFWGEHYVWATSEESRQNALSLHLIGSIVHKHKGTVKIDAETDAVSIDVPDAEKLACAEELGKRVDMTLQ